ncbi:hypothetical protein V6N12_041693 [Hibiscus sabdariffa]|uniref:Inhibitor I9 domain-containing protein n=1 Tax=Hibiscus sabdariffa TaxID=183260 RepID=A0ABR2BIL6_9ROSI
MGDVSHHGDRISAMEEHDNMLLKAIGDEKIARESKIYSYWKSINGFAARLLPAEAKRLSGIWPGCPSFNDSGYGPPPAKWKGKCDKGANFTGCNNKIIGARYYQQGSTAPIMDDPTPVDTDGHGTHTASTVAGIPGNGINIFTMKNKMFPFTDGAHATNLTSNETYFGNSSACDSGTLSEKLVKGKIVYCLGNSGQDAAIDGLHGAGMIMAVDEPTDYYFPTLIPATTVLRSKVGDKLDRYINSTRNPRAVIYRSATVRMVAPSVASFSSRGPSPQSLCRNILKG